MNRDDLDFIYPQELIALEPSQSWRAMLVESERPRELSPPQVLEQFAPGDVLVINDTKVLKRRVFSACGKEILFLKQLDKYNWEVLFPAKKLKLGDSLVLPDGVAAVLVSKGLPQTLCVQSPLTEDYFRQYGELALPPYIQSARGERHNRVDESTNYQTSWASVEGSFAAPTASLHFNSDQLDFLESKGVQIIKITLHVGLGTFLPITSENLDDHTMHSEEVYISALAAQSLEAALAEQRNIWALGTTVTRSLEAWAHGLIEKTTEGHYIGATDIFIRPGFQFKCVNRLMTNFHQPKSTLIALVGAFAGLENVKNSYAWAIKNKFRLFSYGDLTIWKASNCPNNSL